MATKPKAKPKAKAKKRKRRDLPTYRKYTDIERTAAIVLAKTESVSAAVKKLGIPDTTVRAWMNGFRYERSLKLYEEKKGDLAEAFRDTAWECLAIARDKAEDAPFNHLMVASGISVEKSQLLDGKPTTRNRNETADAPVLYTDNLTPDELRLFNSLLARMGTPTRPDVRPPGGTAGDGGAGGVVPRALPAFLT